MAVQEDDRRLGLAGKMQISQAMYSVVFNVRRSVRTREVKAGQALPTRLR